MIIICKKHGEFQRKPCDHLHFRGCPKCASRELYGESICRKFLEIKYGCEFLKARHKWLKYKKSMELDGLNEDKKIAFEYQGMQHFKKIPKYKMTDEDLKIQKDKDRIKRERCKARGINLIEIREFKNLTEKQITISLKNALLSANINFDQTDIDIIKEII